MMALLVDGESIGRQENESLFDRLRRKCGLLKDGIDYSPEYYAVPVFVRPDGVTLKAGCLVWRAGRLYAVRELLVSVTGGSPGVVISPVRGSQHDQVVSLGCELTTLPVEEVELAESRRSSVFLSHKCMRKVDKV